MFLAVIETYAETASFRLAETHTFHKTLPLPPYTTSVGVLGAALGLDLQQAQTFVQDNAISIGTSGRDRGEFRDLWKYRKVKSGDTISDVLIREYRVDLTCLMVYGATDPAIVEQIAAGFKNPGYPLTAGHSDSLMHIRKVEITEAEPQSLQTLENCIAPGDLTSRYEPDSSIFDLPITEKIRPPATAYLPIAFTFNGEVRAVSARETFTFVGNRIALIQPLEGFLIDNQSVVLR